MVLAVNSEEENFSNFTQNMVVLNGQSSVKGISLFLYFPVKGDGIFLLSKLASSFGISYSLSVSQVHK